MDSNDIKQLNKRTAAACYMLYAEYTINTSSNTQYAYTFTRFEGKVINLFISILYSKCSHFL